MPFFLQPILFRLLVCGFAVLLVVQAAWLVPVEVLRPTLPYFPTDQVAGQTAKSKRSLAAVAARLGVVRGDLWADDAISLSAELVGEFLGFDGAPGPQTLADAERAALRTAQLSPHDARAWLLLAAAASRPDQVDRDVVAPLKMSYYTGGDEAALMPLRIRLATRSDVIKDSDLQVLVEQDLRAIALRMPELKPAIVAAYRDAVPSAKRLIETSLDKLDPAFLTMLRAADQPR
jgi:hypothetical protein